MSSGDDEAVDEAFVPKVIPKPADAEDRIKRAVANNFLFKNLDEKQRRIIFDALFETFATPGEAIISEGFRVCVCVCVCVFRSVGIVFRCILCVQIS